MTTTSDAFGSERNIMGAGILIDGIPSIYEIVRVDVAQKYARLEAAAKVLVDVIEVDTGHTFYDIDNGCKVCEARIELIRILEELE